MQACKPRWVFLAIVLLVVVGHSLADVTLVSDGKARAVIVTAVRAPGVVYYAAEELQYHVRKASGVELAIVSENDIPESPAGRVYLGNCKATGDIGIDSASLSPEACLVRTHGDAVFVAGRDMEGEAISQRVWAGTLFGVYELLEDSMGVRWLWPGELGEFVPRSNTVAIKDTDRIVEPRFVQRFIRTTAPHHLNRPEEQVWLRRHRMGRSKTLYPTHAFRNWWKRYGKEHPEYFNLLPNGKREPFGLEHEVSMCVAEPAFWRQIVADWLALPELSPGVRPLIDCSENDGIALCTCPKCRAWDVPPLETVKGELTGSKGKVELVEFRKPLSDRYARFWLAVQQEAATSDPDATVITLAYSTYRQAPRKAKLNDHVIVGLVAKLPSPPTEANIKKNRKEWQGWADTGASLFLRPNYFLQGYCMPYIFAETFGGEFRFAAKHGMIGTDFDSLTGMYATQGPNLYLLGRMHVRPLEEPANLLAEYYGAFGSAAGEVKAYFDYWAEITVRLAEKRPSYPYWPRSVHEIYSAKDFARGQGLLAAARLACGNDELALARVAFLEKGLTNALLTFEAACEIARKASPDSKAGTTGAFEKLARFRRTIKGQYVANLALLRRFESGCGWDWELLDALKTQTTVAELPLRWRLKWDPEEHGRDRKWYAPETDTADWLNVRTNAPWEHQEVGKQWQAQHGKGYDGLAWYRVEFELPPGLADKQLSLLFGAVDEGATVWLNGRLVGEHPFKKPSDWYMPFEMDITEQMYLDRPNTLVVLVEDRSGLGGVWKKVVVVSH